MAASGDSVSERRNHVVVIDDHCRFAHFVWRALAHEIGFGTGEIRKDDAEARRFWNGAVPFEAADPSGDPTPRPTGSEPDEISGFPRPLSTLDQRISVWWVPADQRWQERLHRVLDRIDALVPASNVLASDCWFLIDVRGAQGDVFAPEVRYQPGVEPYNVREVLETLEGRILDFDVKERARVVSSYTSRPIVWGELAESQQFARVDAKSPELLMRLRADLEKNPPARATDSPTSVDDSGTVAHILITGAGFEIRAGGRELGLPLTSDLLWSMGEPFHREGQESDVDSARALELYRLNNGSGFPGLRGDNIKKKKRFELVAEGGDLDEYWTALLELEVLDLITDQHESDAEDRIGLKLTASRREYELREAFRRAVLRYDWGHLNQSIDAASLPCVAWLTTNYTRFSERAINLVEESSRRGRAPARPSWRVIATSAKAELLNRELFYHDPSLDPNNRLLFKLHGDIAHLETMALAGHDKDHYSPLSVPIDNLHKIYGSAERYLIKELAGRRFSRVHWHVVGHALRDVMLLKLIGDVHRHVFDQVALPSRFLLVSPRRPEGPCRRLSDSLGPLTRKGCKIEPVKLDARTYLARLARQLEASDGAEVLRPPGTGSEG